MLLITLHGFLLKNYLDVAFKITKFALFWYVLCFHVRFNKELTTCCELEARLLNIVK